MKVKNEEKWSFYSTARSNLKLLKFQPKAASDLKFAHRIKE